MTSQDTTAPNAQGKGFNLEAALSDSGMRPASKAAFRRGFEVCQTIADDLIGGLETQVATLTDQLSKVRGERDTASRRVIQLEAMLAQAESEHDAYVAESDLESAILLTGTAYLIETNIELGTIRVTAEVPEVGPLELDDRVITTTASPVVVEKRPYPLSVLMTQDVPHLGLKQGASTFIDVPAEVIELLARKHREVPSAFISVPGQHPIVIRALDGKRSERDASDIMLGFAKGGAAGNRTCLRISMAFQTVTRAAVTAELEKLAKKVAAEFEARKPQPASVVPPPAFRDGEEGSPWVPPPNEGPTGSQAPAAEVRR